jgi:2-dehydro-3-deoxygluconokinase
MLELRHHSPTDLTLGFAGDTYNTAVYLRRTGEDLGEHLEVGYVTGLGDDVYSQQMRQAWALEGINDRSVTVPGRAPGLYAVQTDHAGERSFRYWRHASAASVMFQTRDWVPSLCGDLVHFSGLTLQLMSRETRAAFLTRLTELRDAGTLVSFDTNYRPEGWADQSVARTTFRQAASHSDIVLATLTDELELFPDKDEDDVVDRYLSLGASEVVVKLGAHGAIAAERSGHRAHVPAVRVDPVVDTTAAGDSFAGAYLAGRLAGLCSADAAGLGAELAAAVIRVPGAIAPPQPTDRRGGLPAYG